MAMSGCEELKVSDAHEISQTQGRSGIYRHRRSLEVTRRWYEQTSDFTPQLAGEDGYGLKKGLALHWQ
jgi:hypothetical protein